MIEIADLQKLNSAQLIDIIVFLEDVNSLPAVDDMMRQLEYFSRRRHFDAAHTKTWKTCTIGSCVEHHRILGKIYMEKASNE